MIIKRLADLGYTYEPAPLPILSFHSAAKVGNLIFTRQIPSLGDVQIKGRVGGDIDIQKAQKAAEICAYNCIRAAGAVIDIKEIKRVVKVLGLVNYADGFDQMSEVVNGCSTFYTKVFGDAGLHARSAVGARLPSEWAVEVETIFEI